MYFEEPFWVGAFERIRAGKLSVCKVTFGAEPRDYEVWDFVLRNYCRLRFSPAVQAKQRQAADSPKRRQRNAGKQMRQTGIGTRSQQALSAQREQMKAEHKSRGRAQQEAEKQRRFDMRREKQKEKHRGH